MFKNIFLILIISLSAGISGADTIESYFKSFEGRYKGPFGPNMMQMKNKRLSFNKWQSAGSPSFVFQSAFRSEKAQELISKHGIYAGNLFATNYYELRAEFLRGDARAPYLSELDDLESLSAMSELEPKVFDKAKQMVKNWNLEKVYVLKNPRTKLAKSFSVRGVAGAEFEAEYGKDFVSFYVSQTKDNLDLLPIYYLVKSSAIMDSSNLNTIRSRATAVYDIFNVGGSKEAYMSDSQRKELYKIRNAIHNNLTPAVIPQIDRFTSKIYPRYKRDGHTELFTIRSLILKYFAISVKEIKSLAKESNLPYKVVSSLDIRKPKLENLTAYSKELLSARAIMLSRKETLKSKYLELLYLSSGTDFLYQKAKRFIRKNKINDSNIKEISNVLLDTLYLQGYLSKKQYEQSYEIEYDFDVYDEFLGEISDHMIANTKAVYAPYLEKWKMINTNVNYIVDDAVRSSSLSLFDNILEGMD